jgi:eukaryotic-like serine/threonine-protein kinase
MTEVATGTLVDGRYRIRHRIGSGGMADVYCAEDTHLGRQVALKVLHRRFAQDQEFVERFRREAKSVAGLSHPNVVGVFDRGGHDGTYYIAMEHLAGRTLKEIVESEAPLPQERAIDLAQQILQGAGYAHRHGVIHRDFKPHNVIVDDDGRTKVTDFGIARAGASEMTETGSIMGTAQYLSPEQAQGHAVTAASDLYSIGVMLYEMLAGRLPFEGESAVSIALKHLSEAPPPLSRFRPDVHPAVETVVMAALAKDPAQRWQSADDFANGLEAARAQMDAGAGDEQDFAALAPIPVPASTPAPEAEASPVVGRDGAVPPVAEPERRRRSRWPWFTIGLLTVALAGFLLYLGLSGAFEPEKVEVPRVTGQQLVQARAVLERAGFEVAEARVRSSQPFDQVIDQDPNAGEEADDGSTITLEVSNGPGTVRVPSVAKLPQEQAIDDLQDADLRVTTEPQSSDEIGAGFAIRTVPRAGEEVERDTRVTLFVSTGPEQVTVPDVVGLSSDSAEASLAAEGLGVAVQEQESEEAVGEVIAQSPEGGAEVDRGTTVTITVSTGIEQIDVPNVVGLSPRDAAGQISSAGLTPVRSERSVTDPAEDGVVIDQRPGAGVELDEGGQVVIIVGVLQPEEEVQPLPPPAGENSEENPEENPQENPEENPGAP